MKVYIVDDDSRTATIYKNMIEAAQDTIKTGIVSGYAEWQKLLEMGTGNEAVLCIDETLSGWEEPNGIELGAAFKKRWVHTPLIIYSNEATNYEAAYKAGAEHYLPFAVMVNKNAFSQILTTCIVKAAKSITLDTLQKSIDQLPLEFMLVDDQYRIIMANRKKLEVCSGEILGKVCYQVFHKREDKCANCPVQDIMENEKQVAQWKGWLPDPVWNNKAQAMLEHNFLAISAYPIDTPRGRFIAETVDDQTAAQVIIELTRKLPSLKEYEEIAKWTIESVKKLGYTHSRIYILSADEKNIEYYKIEEGEECLTLQDLKKLGQETFRLFKEENERTRSGKWPLDNLAQIPESKKLPVKEGTEFIYSLITQEINPLENNYLGVLLADREKDARQITDHDKKDIETITSLIANTIGNIRTVKTREKEARQVESCFNLLRTLLQKLQTVRTADSITGTMLDCCKEIVPDSTFYYYHYNERKKEFVVISNRNTAQNPENNIAGREINTILEKAYSKQGIVTDEQTYLRLQRRSKQTRGTDFLPPEVFPGQELPFLAFPVTHKNERYGVLLIYRSNAGAYKDLEVEMIHTILNACAINFFNTRAALTLEQAADQWQSLGILHKYLSESKSFDGLIMRCLTFITAGEGLGFNRALYFEYVNEKKHYQFKRAIGSITEEEFKKVKKTITDNNLDFEALIKIAPDVKDNAINDNFKDFIIDQGCTPLWDILRKEEPGIIDLLQQPANENYPAIRELKKRCDLVYYIVTAIPGQETSPGCLLVDRRFSDVPFTAKDAPFTAKDTLFLKTFAAEMTRIFESFEYQDLRPQYTNTLGWMTSALGHELAQPALALHAAADLLVKYLDREQYTKVKEKAGAVIKAKTRITDTIEAIKGFIDIDKKESIEPGQIINQSKLLFAEKLKNHGIECTVEIEPGLPVMEIHSTSLKYAITNLVRNAFDEFISKEKRIVHPSIEIHCKKRDKHLVFQVKDNAGGIAPEVLKKIRKQGSTLSTKPFKGWGYGLNIVKQAAQMHAGEFTICNTEDGKGAIAEIAIPLKDK